MPDLEDISYSENECVEAIKDYYAFLSKMYLDPSKIRTPPQEGWPDITPDVFRELEKTDAVISLLRRLPYVDCSSGDEIMMAARCHFADWSRNGINLLRGKVGAGSLRLITEGEDASATDCCHVIGLTEGGRDETRLLLDTENGIVIWLECPGEIDLESSQEGIGNEPHEYAQEDEIEWRADAEAWPIGNFFELLKDRFRNLQFVPLSQERVVDTLDNDSRSEEANATISMVQDIYREHGWPDEDRFRKAECQAAIERILREQDGDD